jgi:hypothetical protein
LVARHLVSFVKWCQCLLHLPHFTSPNPMVVQVTTFWDGILLNILQASTFWTNMSTKLVPTNTYEFHPLSMVCSWACASPLFRRNHSNTYIRHSDKIDHIWTQTFLLHLSNGSHI